MMRFIPESAFRNISKSTDLTIPLSLDTICPHCKHSVNFSLRWGDRANNVVRYTISHCPSCQKKVTLLFLLKEKKDAGNKGHSGNLFIVPGSTIRKPLAGIDDNPLLEEGLKRAYYSAIEVYNTRVWTATSVTCRRVLEGITKSILPEKHRNKPLASQLKDLPSHIDIAKPILTLADTIRKGGNLGAHFESDLEKEPNEEITTLMLDFLDYLIEYIYILPERINELHEKIEKIAKK